MLTRNLAPKWIAILFWHAISSAGASLSRAMMCLRGNRKAQATMVSHRNVGPFSLEESVAPAVEPISTAEAKSYMSVDYATDDTLIDDLIKTARIELEEQCGLSFVNTTWILRLDGFPTGEIVVPRSPLSSVTSITYLDINGDSQTWDSSKYQVDTKSKPGRVKPTEAEGNFPSTQSATYNAVTMTFVAGFGAAASNVPEDYQMLVRRVVRQLYDDERNPDANTRTPAHIVQAIMNKRQRWVV